MAASHSNHLFVEASGAREVKGVNSVGFVTASVNTISLSNEIWNDLENVNDYI